MKHKMVLDPSRPIPRLTGAIRAFSNVSAPSKDKVHFDPEIWAFKRRQHAERHARETCVTWNEINETFSSVHGASEGEVRTALRELRTIARNMMGSDVNEDVIENSAAFLFAVFQDGCKLGQKQSDQLKSMFGPFRPSVVSAAHCLVNKMVSWLPENVQDSLLNRQNSEECNGLMEVEFGHKIKFVGFRVLGEDRCNLVDEDNDRQSYELSFQYNDTQPSDITTTKSSDSSQKPRYDRKWLTLALQHSDTSSVDLTRDEDLTTSVLGILSSTKSKEELGNELFELLGCNRMSLIESLLEHRDELIKNQAASVLTEGLSKSSSLPKRPTYGCQVVVQTEEQKQLQKMIRKDEKRIKEIKPSTSMSTNNLDFDPHQLKQLREQQLLAAMRAPLFSKRSAAYSTPVRYPNVYDSYAEAKMSASYISGSKMVLPLEHKRTDSSKYEEITIPGNGQVPPDVLKNRKLVRIDTLNEIAQLGFKGMKELNLIQSIVFDTAFHTNENLLICAPTGAGKTNIAMLTILHEIRQNTEGDVLKREKFKIVYVAPMKALAGEMVRNFSDRLAPLGIVVRELTGDMQLTKAEIMNTQILVTTPEKWDVVTRKSIGDIALTNVVKLLILDEVHLLHGDRGPVLEALVARTLRQVELTQTMIRIVALSATLPNYVDVAAFLRVNPNKGLFYFDGRFRPVPLTQTFIGVKAMNSYQELQDMDDICYRKVSEMVSKGHQVMVFVHARNMTLRTAQVLKDLAQKKGHSQIFLPSEASHKQLLAKHGSRCHNKNLQELFQHGFAIHHAGMFRHDRNLVEQVFREGAIKVLVCTATLAWGVNLPAHAVIIKGTDLYDAQRGGVVDLDSLDVMQIFGRAGRPQYDTSGHGTIITTQGKLSHFLSLLTSQQSIESKFHNYLADNLNAEISLGTVSTIDEAVEWLSYTYYYIRIRRNPHHYGIMPKMFQEDPHLLCHQRDIITKAARELDKNRMIRFDEKNGYLSSTDLGRTASHFYIKYDTVGTFSERLIEMMTEGDVFAMVSQAHEFKGLKEREDEKDELELLEGTACEFKVQEGPDGHESKVNIMLQAHISRVRVDASSLVSDQAYVVQNGVRIVRALFEIVLRKNWAIMAERLLTLSKVLERQMWAFQNPLHQFPDLKPEVLRKLDEKHALFENLKEMSPKEIGEWVRHPAMGKVIKERVTWIPSLLLEASVHPITRSLLRIKLEVRADFKWNDKEHGRSEPFWIWVEDPNVNYIYHSEYFILTKKQARSEEPQTLVFTIPIAEPLPAQYIVRAVSDKWLGSENTIALSFQHLILPEHHPPHTDLLDLDPLPLTALNNTTYEMLYNFTHFNAIQTQMFHTLYHTDYNVLLGAPTGSGKTIAAEIAMFRIFETYPGTKVVYIAPLKALVRERITDWNVRFIQQLGKQVVELTGDVMPDAKAIQRADVIVTTPEKWDGVSRSWQTRNYVQEVSLIVIDEIHLLGEDRGPVLEVIVSRTNFISAHTKQKLRIIGLSTALANARDLADWLRIDEVGMYNFRSQVRPVPLTVHIQSFPGKHYCPRMARMNKPAYQAIKTHSPTKPVLVFVSSRRQTRLTALDLMAFLATEDNPRQWLHMQDGEMDSVLQNVRDQNLKLTLAFGIGLHHAGLQEKDRNTVEELFVNQRIQVLITTATLAWGVNFPAHLVVVKGTEYYDGKVQRYVDFPITDVLQMVGRAGRPQFDEVATAVVMVHDIKKEFYRKFLYEPFPVESSLVQVLPEHLNAEIVTGTVSSKQDCIDYLTWTYFFRRLLRNPSYYTLDRVDHSGVNQFLSSLVDGAIQALESAYCVEMGEDNRSVGPTVLGRIASYYYLNHQTVGMFREKLVKDVSLELLLVILSDVTEYNELPVRHNEDSLNSILATNCPLKVNPYTMDSPHTKAHILFQAHFSRLQLPCADYETDLKSVLDQSIRVVQAMIDVAADQGLLVTTLRIIEILQMLLQARWIHESSLLTLPHVEPHHLPLFRKVQGKTCTSLPLLIHLVRNRYESLASILRQEFEENQIQQMFETLTQLPLLKVSAFVSGGWEDQGMQKKQIHFKQHSGAVPDKDWIRLHADQEYVLTVDLTRQNRSLKPNTKALAPKFPKYKDEGWFLVLGDTEKGELLALKRIGHVPAKSSNQVIFYSPETIGRATYTLYLLSDSYIGLDQQFDIFLEATESSLECQVNSEAVDEELKYT